MMRILDVEDEEVAPGESMSERQKRMAEMHEEIQLGNFGPDHRALALVAAAEDVADERPNVGAAPIGALILRAYEQGLQVAGQDPVVIRPVTCLAERCLLLSSILRMLAMGQCAMP